MSSPQIVFHPEAVAEAQAAARWYRERSVSAGEAFLNELDNAVEMISASPEIGAQYVQNTRRHLFRRFPFYLVYRKVSKKLEIIAVAHGRRRPGYWKDRMA